ncbi:Rpn family recombination-promoting nuclease/putative transposase [Blautia schinkii]|nr:Rpn family recombination-promoting nuclease/putative transposase [Blautia schinkii]
MDIAVGGVCLDSRTILPEDNGLQARYEKYKNIIKNLTIMSDVFMRNVFKKMECVEYVLQIILEKKNLKVLEQVIQKDYKNLRGRSAILDCVVRDADDKRFDVEIQQDNEGASPKRARYHSGLMDMNTLNPGQDFDELPQSYVIFITREDVLGYGLPIYHISRKINEIDKEFRDESHIIYVNSQIQDDTELGRLMHDLHCKNADEMYSEVLARCVRELKETQEGVDSMCREMDEIYYEGIEFGEKRGLELGEMKAKKETALSLAEMGISVEKIAQAVKVSASVVQKWISEEMALVK